MHSLDYIQTDFVRLSSRSLSEVVCRWIGISQRNSVHDGTEKADTNAFPFSEEVPAEHGEPDEVEAAVTKLRSGDFVVSSDEEMFLPPKNPLRLHTR